MSSISTLTGDDGTTGLFFNRRVPKTHPQVEAYGAVDELNAALGLCRALRPGPKTEEEILRVQSQLVTLMGELCVLPEDRAHYVEKGFKLVSAGMVEELTGSVHEIEKTVKADGWSTPGANPLSAALENARVTCRRAERRVLALGEAYRKLNPELTRYLNRLSDLLWLMARQAESPS